MDNTLSTTTNDDPHIQLEQLKKSEVEQKGRDLLKRETTVDISYSQIIEKGLTGFMQAYIIISVNDKTMSTKAKQEVVINLAESDLSRDQTLILNLLILYRQSSLRMDIVNENKIYKLKKSSIIKLHLTNHTLIHFNRFLARHFHSWFFGAVHRIRKKKQSKN